MIKDSERRSIFPMNITTGSCGLVLPAIGDAAVGSLSVAPKNIAGFFV